MYSEEQYKKAFDLRKEGFTYNEIKEKLNLLSLNAAYGWIKKRNLPRGSFLSSDAKKLSPELAYILGVIQGDGYVSISRTKGCAKLEAKDKDFVKNFKNKLSKWSGQKSYFNLRKDRNLYTATLNSLRASQFLKDFNIYNLSNTKKDIKISFLRGLFDSEGGVSGYNLSTPRTATRFIAFYNTDKDLIFLVKNMLESLGIRVQNIDKRIKSGFSTNTLLFRLRIGGKENLEKFNNTIRFSIKRKNKKLEEVLRSYKKNV
ncbi:MAG: LAGLIDADG family homing endonuclease [Candidatus Nanoarchaeia archaeon]